MWVSLAAVLTLQKALAKSILLEYLALPSLSNTSTILGKGEIINQVLEFKHLKLIHILSSPVFILINNTGEL